MPPLAPDYSPDEMDVDAFIPIPFEPISDLELAPRADVHPIPNSPWARQALGRFNAGLLTTVLNDYWVFFRLLLPDQRDRLCKWLGGKNIFKRDADKKIRNLLLEPGVLEAFVRLFILYLLFLSSGYLWFLFSIVTPSGAHRVRTPCSLLRAPSFLVFIVWRATLTPRTFASTSFSRRCRGTEAFYQRWCVLFLFLISFNLF
jgi:hypothetical protein